MRTNEVKGGLEITEGKEEERSETMSGDHADSVPVRNLRT